MNADSCVVWERVREPVSSGAAACVRYGTRLENVPEEVQGLGVCRCADVRCNARRRA